MKYDDYLYSDMSNIKQTLTDLSRKFTALGFDVEPVDEKSCSCFSLFMRDEFNKIKMMTADTLLDALESDAVMDMLKQTMSYKNPKATTVPKARYRYAIRSAEEAWVMACSEFFNTHGSFNWFEVSEEQAFAEMIRSSKGTMDPHDLRNRIANLYKSVGVR